jgi:phospholipase/lecithinase/hemolysin
MILSPVGFRIGGHAAVFAAISPDNCSSPMQSTPPPTPRFLRVFASAFFAVVLLVSGLVPARLAAQGNSDNAPRNAPFSAIRVLGDSLSDTGRAYNAIGLPPAPFYFNGRFSNGPLWIDYLAPSLRMSTRPVDNFSWAGANTGRLNVFPGLPGMRDELDELLASGRKLDRHALYVVFGGANDFIRILSGSEDPLVVITEAVSNLVETVWLLRAAGAEHIVVVDLPNIGLTPRALAGGPAVSGGATYLSVVFNQLLETALQASDLPVIRVSAFRLLNAMVADPAAYGLTDVTSPGLFDPASGDTHLFWDDIHPTTRAHRAISAAIFDELAKSGLLTQLLKHPGK